MYITNVTEYYNNTLSINNNLTNNVKNIEIIIPFFTIIRCGMSLNMFNIAIGIHIN